MKKLFFVFGLSAVTLGVSANAFKHVRTVQTAMQQQTASKEVEIEAAKLPEKVTKNIMDGNKDRKIAKAFQILDAAGILTGYKVVTLTDKHEDIFKYDKNGDMLKEVITPNPNAAPKPADKK